MQIDDDTAIHGERAEESVLHLDVRRFESAAKSGDDEHHSSEGERRPIVREKCPGRRRCRESTEIRMDGQQGTIGPVLKKIFPSRPNAKRIEIENDSAQAKKYAAIKHEFFFCETQID